MEDAGIQLPADWVALPGVVASGSSDEHRFVWQESGRDTYEALLGEYLDPPVWRVRFAAFEGDVAERAVAESGVVEAFPVEFAALEEISAVSTKRPNRRDWVFTFRDGGALSSSKGEARIRIDIAGDEIVEAHRGVHVPEQWLRDDASDAVAPQLIRVGGVIVMVLMFVAGAVVAIINWSRKKLSVRVFFSFFALVFGLMALAFANSWSATVARFSTAQPFANQVVLLVSGALLGFVVLSATTALVLGWLHRWQGGTASTGFAASLWMGAALGAAGAGLTQLGDMFGPLLEPPWGDFSGAEDYLPVATAALGGLNGYITSTTMLLLVICAINHWSGGWTQRKGLFPVAFLPLGLLFSSLGIGTVSSWLISGVARRQRIVDHADHAAGRLVGAPAAPSGPVWRSDLTVIEAVTMPASRCRQSRRSARRG